MSEADNATEWVRIMVDRCKWGGNLDIITAEAEALGPDGRESVQRIFEHITFEKQLGDRLADYGNGDDAES